MYKTAKCPHCGQRISNVHFEAYEPAYSKGGSSSFVAVAYPCGHALGAVPVIWESKMNTIQELIAKQNQSIQNTQYQVSDMQMKINQIIQYLRNKQA